jgi:hypothetical protein
MDKWGWLKSGSQGMITPILFYLYDLVANAVEATKLEDTKKARWNFLIKILPSDGD